MRYTLAQLEAFTWIARLKSFRAAAAHLNLTQPTISLRIRELERALDIRLFDRSGYRAQLTQQGATMLRQAEKMIELAREIELAGRDRDPLAGLLRIGAADTFALTCLPDLLAALERDHPALAVELSIDFSWNLSQQLANRSLDIAFLTMPTPAPNVTAVTIGAVDIAWVASPRLPLPTRPLVPSDLAGLQILTNPPPSHLYRTIREWFSEEGLEPERLSTCNSLSVMARLAAAGLGVSVLPTSILAAEFDTGLLRPLAARKRLPPHTLCVAYQSDEAGPGIDAVIAAAEEIMRRKQLFGAERR
jgi:DNA-binding transcriptional LysR family regulator